MNYHLEVVNVDSEFGAAQKYKHRVRHHSRSVYFGRYRGSHGNHRQDLLVENLNVLQLIFTLGVGLEADHLEQKSQRCGHNLEESTRTLWFVIGPVSTLAFLTTVLRELAARAGAERDKGHEAIRVTRILSLRRARIILLKAPGAVLGHAEHVNYGHDWVTLHDRLPHICPHDSVHSD